jgi:PAS domain S-box-containing protein
MSERKRVFLLILIMVVVSMIVTWVTITMLYRAALNEEKARLVETAQSQARLIEAVARFDSDHQKKWHPHLGTSEQATLSQIIDAHKHYMGFGKTGEFTLSKKEGNNIVFLLSHRHYDLDKPKPISFDSKLAEPMRLALSGKSGTVIGLDYRGETVLAAHEPVGELNLGIVAKIDLSEIRSPFVRAGLISALIAALAILLGAWLFIKVTNPMIRGLTESEERFRLLVNGGRDYAIFMLDPGGRIISWNPGAKRIKGYQKDEIVGRHFSCFYSKEDIEAGKPERALEITVSEGRFEEEGWRLRKDGSRFWASVLITALRDERGNLRGFSKVTRDITERKLAEEQIKASLKEKEILLREIHHRVKNNMQVVISLLRLQSDKIKDQQYVEMLKESQDRIKSMALIHEKLYQSEDFANIDFDGYVKALVNSLFISQGVSPDKISLKMEIADISLGLDYAIPCGLIINELVSNSLKYAFPKERQGEIRIGLQKTSENEVELTVSDNGIGIPEGLDFGTIESLGLDLVKILAEHQLGGKIELNRAGGTSFSFRFTVKTDKTRI